MEIIIAALVAAVPATWMAAGAWRATIRNEQKLTTENGTTTAQYTEQTHELVRILSRQMEDHVTNQRIHYASTN